MVNVFELLLKFTIALSPFVFMPGMDMRTPKEIFVLAMTLSLILTAFYQGIFKKFTNVYLLIFLGFCYISILLSQNYSDFVMTHMKPINGQIALEILQDRNVSSLWMFKAYFYIFMYALLLMAVASFEFTIASMEKILKVMMVCAVITAIYIFIQKLGLDQFMGKTTVEKNPDVNNVTQALLGGFIGQPTVVSPFMAMMFPICMYFRKYLFAVIIVIAVLMTQSKMACGSLIVAMCFLAIFSTRIVRIILSCLALVSLLCCSVYFVNDYIKLDHKERYFVDMASGRVSAWKDMYEFYKTPVNGKKYTVTGLGPGSFNYAYSIRKSSSWKQVHNDPFEALQNFGIAGVSLLFLAIFVMIKNLEFDSDQKLLIIALLTSLLTIFLCSLGTFPLQIAPIYFYTLIILGFLHNRQLSRGSYEASDIR